MDQTRNSMSPSQHENHIRNICGTFAVEGMTISDATLKNLDRIASGQADYRQVLEELRKTKNQ